jgi:hypothetical protein
LNFFGFKTLKQMRVYKKNKIDLESSSARSNHQTQNSGAFLPDAAIIRAGKALDALGQGLWHAHTDTHVRFTFFYHLELPFEREVIK